MNKKFLSAILFGALMVSSTGTFVSCKDYDDDIENLQGQIDAQKSGVDAQISALQSALNAANSEIAAAKASADAAKQAAAQAKADAIAEALEMFEDAEASMEEIANVVVAIDSELLELAEEVDEQTAAINTLEIQVEALQGYKALIDGKASAADVEAVEKAIAEIKEAMKSIASSETVSNLDKEVEELANKVAKLSEDLVTIEAKSLRALVFVPSLYLDGVESFRYPYAPGHYLAALNGSAEGTVDAYLDQPAADFKIPSTSKWAYSASAVSYTLTPIQTIYYHLNPSNAKIDDVAFELTSNDAEFVDSHSRAAATKWTAQFVKATKDGCELAVDYKIAAPQYIKWAGEHDQNSIVSLHATLEEGKTVNSDFASVLPAVQRLEAIAFVDKTTPAIDCAIGDELWLSGYNAAKNAPSISIAYNKGGINLDELLNIHYTQEDFDDPEDDAEHLAMDYNVAKEKYGLKFEYEMMPYYVGKNETNESMYGKIVDNMFYPCYVKTGATPTQELCGVDTEVGISAVGKMPIVQVRLIDTATNKVVLNGYIKLHIVKEIGYKAIVLKTFELPIICGNQEAKITWDEASDLIYEAIGKSKEEFHNEFVPESGAHWPYVKKVVNGKETFVKTTSDQKLGTMDSSQDGEGAGSTNSGLYYNTEFGQYAVMNIAKLPNRSETFYYRYVSKTDESYSVYLGLTIKVAQAPEATFGEKIAAYWYSDITGKAQENVRNNVPRPTTAGIAAEDVKDYVKDLDDNFKGNNIVVSLTAAAQNKLYKEGKYSTSSDYKFETKHKYQFAATQPKVGTYQLSRGATNFQKLFVGNVEIANITNDGVLTYLDNETAKAVLNLYSHSETTASKMQYANVEVVAVYGDCELPLATYDFQVRFLRPVDILEGPKAFFEDAQANGSAVVLGNFIKLQDWRDMDLIALSGSTFVSAVENECKLFDYYLFKNIKIDIDNASSTLTGKKELLKDVTDKLQLKIDDNGTEYATSTTVDFSSVSALNTTKIVYYNNEGNVQEFKLYIPIEITYSWGTLKGEIEATVGKTKNN